MDSEKVTAIVVQSLVGSAELKTKVAQDPSVISQVEVISRLCVDTFRAGGKVLFCGNGGSAADAQHLAAEFSGRFYYDRGPLPSEALHCNTSYLTAVANDYSYDLIYSRLVRGMGRKGDVLIGLSTSGNSKNIVEAFKVAREIEMTTVGFTGDGGGAMAVHSDHLIAIPSKDTPRIQECHMTIGHAICQAVEATLFPRP